MERLDGECRGEWMRCMVSVVNVWNKGLFTNNVIGIGGGSAKILYLIMGRGGRSKYYGIMGRVGDKYDEFLSSSILMIFLLLLLTFSQHPVSAYRI